MSGNQLAMLEHGGVGYYAEYCPAPHEPNSAVTQLIQGLYQQFPERARDMLRNRIYINYQPSLMCEAMIQVAAKRFTVHESINIRKCAVKISYEPDGSLLDSSSGNFDSLLKWISEPVPDAGKLSNPRRLRDRHVRAMLTDRSRSIIIISRNHNSLNKTLHAEIILLQGYYARYRSAFTDETELYTSLQCCKMCAAMYWHMHTRPLENLRSFYLHADTGPAVRNSVLAVSSAARRSKVGNGPDCQKVLEEQYSG